MAQGSSFSRIILNAGKEQSPKRFHPWVFSGAIKKIQGSVQDGDIVEVYSNKEEFLGVGHYQDGSIAVRIFSFEKIQPDQDFWTAKIQQAYDYRKRLQLADNPNTNVYRLVYAEGDGLPGLIIDYYNGTAVLQAHTLGMHRLTDMLVIALRKVMGESLKAVYDKSSETLPKMDHVQVKNAYLWGNAEQQIVVENGHRFYIDWETGQKTGFFIDQRENRLLLAHYAKDKAVLNTFCYTGGFSIYALNAGASLVHSVDSSKKAIELTDKNVLLNTGDAHKHQSFAEETFAFLKRQEQRYDIIILDPPAFAKHHNVKHNAVMGYKRLNAEAMKVIQPGGLLFTFSCSQVVDKYLFHHTLLAAAIEAGRKVRVMHYLSQPPCHAHSIFHPEGEYLKGMVLAVE